MPMAFFFIISFVAEKKSDVFSIYIGLLVYLSANGSPDLSVVLAIPLFSFTHMVGFPQTLKARSRYYLDLAVLCPVLQLASLNIS